MRFFILMMLSVSLPVIAAEKYRTWIDSDGNVQMQKIQEEQNPFLPEGVTFEPENTVRENNNQTTTGKSDAEVSSGERGSALSADPVKSDATGDKPLPSLANPENTSSGDAPRVRSDLDITVVDESEFVVMSLHDVAIFVMKMKCPLMFGVMQRGVCRIHRMFPIPIRNNQMVASLQ